MNEKALHKNKIWFKLVFSLNFLIGIALILAYLNTHVSPNTIPYISYLGLAYPVLLLSIVLFSIYWLIFYRKYIIFNLVIFILGWNHFTDFVAFNNSTKVPAASDFKLLSYNVRIFNYYDKKNNQKTRLKIIDFLKKQNADVYCFQEFYHQDGKTNFNTKDTLLELLQTNYFHERYTHEMTGKQFFGLATFSKFPIINKGGIKFSNDANNYCIYSDIIKNNDTIRIFNAHLGSIRLPPLGYNLFKESKSDKINDTKPINDIAARIKKAFEKRAIQIELVMNTVKKSPYKTILCGDFNDTPVSYCYNRIENELIDAFIESSSGIGSTYIGKFPFNRIDYIFYSNKLQSKEFKTHSIKYSDHKPISCYIGNVFD